MKARKIAPEGHSESNKTSHNHKRGNLLQILNRYPKWVLILIAALIVIRATIPPIGKWVINRHLERELGEYRGHVSDFDLSLWKGAYRLQNFEIKKIRSDLPPILAVDEIQLSISWKGLLHGKITSNLKLRHPVVHLVDSKSKENKQFGVEESKEAWQSVFDTIVPIKIENFQIINGTIDFMYRELSSPMMLKLENVELTARDLRTREKDRMSPFSMEAMLQGQSKIVAEGSLDILTIPYKIDMDFQFEKFHLNSINKLLLVYVPIDVTRGDLSAYGEVAYAGDAVGYMKIFLKSADIIDPKQDYKGPKHFFVELLGSLGTWFLENNKTHNVAAEIPFHFRKGVLDVNTTKAFWSAVKNQDGSLTRKIDDKISLKNLGKEPALGDQTENPSTVDKKVQDKAIKGQHSSKKAPSKNKK